MSVFGDLRLYAEGDDPDGFVLRGFAGAVLADVSARTFVGRNVLYAFAGADLLTPDDVDDALGEARAEERASCDAEHWNDAADAGGNLGAYRRLAEIAVAWAKPRSRRPTAEQYRKLTDAAHLLTLSECARAEEILNTLEA